MVVDVRQVPDRQPYRSPLLAANTWSTDGIGGEREKEGQAICVGTRFAEWEAREDMFGLCEHVEIVK